MWKCQKDSRVRRSIGKIHDNEYKSQTETRVMNYDTLKNKRYLH